MNPNLFKSAEFYRRRYHNFATVFIIPLVLLVIFLLLFSLFAQKEITITALGEITPTKVIASIQSSSNNTILTNHLINNQLIEKDDVAIHYSESMESSQKQALELQLERLKRQKTGLETLKESLTQGSNLFSEEDEFGYSHTFQNFISQSQDIELGISKINTEVQNQTNLTTDTIRAIDDQITHLHQQITEYEELRQAITSRSPNLSDENPHQATLRNFLDQPQSSQEKSIDSYLTQINQSISGLESSIASLTIQKASTGTVATYDMSSDTKVEILRTQFLQSASQQLLTVETQITEVQAQLEQSSLLLEQNTLLSPGTGILHLNPEFEGKNQIPSGSEIAQIYPTISDKKEVLITYYVPSQQVSLLKKEQTVRLSLEKVGNQAITIIGAIQAIDQTATRTEKGNLFKVTALAKLTDTDSKLIQYGLQGRVTSVIAQKTYFEYYKDKIFNDFD